MFASHQTLDLRSGHTLSLGSEHRLGHDTSKDTCECHAAWGQRVYGSMDGRTRGRGEASWRPWTGGVAAG